jgi:hypothetical protein
MSTQTKTCEKDQENRLHTVRRGAGVSANAVSIWAATAFVGITMSISGESQPPKA